MYVYPLLRGVARSDISVGKMDHITEYSTLGLGDIPVQIALHSVHVCWVWEVWQGGLGR